VIERAVILGRGPQILPEDLPVYLCPRPLGVRRGPALPCVTGRAAADRDQRSTTSPGWFMMQSYMVRACRWSGRLRRKTLDLGQGSSRGDNRL